jgi:predicted type IV restriction endonuclease
MSDVTAQAFREAAEYVPGGTNLYRLLLAAAEQREALDRVTASLDHVKREKDQRIIELVQRVATLTAERDELRAKLGPWKL